MRWCGLESRGTRPDEYVRADRGGWGLASAITIAGVYRDASFLFLVWYGEMLSATVGIAHVAIFIW